MSQTESHFGKIIKIDGDAENLCQEVINDRNDQIDQHEYNQSAIDYVEENYEDYAVFNNTLYRVEDTELVESDIYKSWLNHDGSIGYAVSFYNGGCGFLEALEDAVKDKIERS